MQPRRILALLIPILALGLCAQADDLTFTYNATSATFSATGTSSYQGLSWGGNASGSSFTLPGVDSSAGPFALTNIGHLQLNSPPQGVAYTYSGTFTLVISFTAPPGIGPGNTQASLTGTFRNCTGPSSGRPAGCATLGEGSVLVDFAPLAFSFASSGHTGMVNINVGDVTLSKGEGTSLQQLGGTISISDATHPQIIIDDPEPGPNSPTPVPEPASMFLLGSGLVGAGRMLRKKMRK